MYRQTPSQESTTSLGYHKLSLAAQTNKATLFDNLLQDKSGVSAQMVWPRFELGTDAPGREFSKTYSFFSNVLARCCEWGATLFNRTSLADFFKFLEVTRTQTHIKRGERKPKAVEEQV